MSIFHSLKYRNYRLFFYGQSVSLIGTWMQKVAVSWLVYRLTHSAFLLGVVGFASLIPSLVLSPYAGTLTDRHDRYRILLVTQVASMLQAGALALLVWTRDFNIHWLVWLSLLQGIVNAFDNTARQSLMVELIEEKKDLPNAIALYSSMANFARLLGPALAGILLSTLGEDFCFFANFVSYIAVLASLLMVRLKKSPLPKKEDNIWDGLREGYIYLENSPGLLSLIILLAACSLLVIPFSTLMPVFAKDLFRGDAKTFSWFESAAGLGALLGAAFMAARGAGGKLIKLMIGSGILFGFSLILLSTSRLLPLSLLFMMAAGMGMMIQTSSINTYIQTHCSPAMRGRIISYYLMAYQGLFPLGSLLTGALANHAGARVTVGVEGCLGIASTVLFLLYKKKYINALTARRYTADFTGYAKESGKIPGTGTQDRCRLPVCPPEDKKPPVLPGGSFRL
ncbi:MAG: MFS transporter [Puia sp.]|nr:MFS transporter [Puia sp.]